MIVDTSALIAIFAKEPEASRFRQVLIDAAGALVSAGTWIEFATVLVRKFQLKDPSDALAAVQAAFDLDIVPVTVEQASIATSFYATFGRGSRHPAKLNLGDCFAYALAKSRGEPLLFTGEGFAHTDVIPVI